MNDYERGFNDGFAAAIRTLDRATRSQLPALVDLLLANSEIASNNKLKYKVKQILGDDWREQCRLP